MRRDAIYYQLLKRFPSLFFALLDNPPKLAQNYTFDSIEIKETSFRIDGVFLPPKNADNKIVYFCEIQFQQDDTLYARFFAELFLSIYRNLDSFDNWFGVLIFPSRSLIPKNKDMYKALLDSNQVKQIFIDELDDTNSSSIGISLIKLPTLSKTETIQKAKKLIEKIQERDSTTLPKQEIIEMISTIAVYRFDKLTRKEVEDMLGLRIEDTRVYQDAMTEGKLELVLRLLSKRIGKLSPDLQAEIKELSPPQIESLGEALLDFSESVDLENWLQNQ